MTSRDFCFWLQGYLEIETAGGEEPLINRAQVACIQRHLQLVFKHEIDPSMGGAHKNKILDDIHTASGGFPGGGGSGPTIRC
jgi:hypothetical protein